MREVINVEYSNGEYEIIIEHNIINNLSTILNEEKRYFIVSDSNVSKLYLDTVKSQLNNNCHYIIDAGEQSKSFENLQLILEAMVKCGIERSDSIIALGGGVVGDICGLAASLYMRGINYINIPTTTLSQIDSSVGGKVAIDFCGIKNIIGDFYFPSLVLIDTSTLTTLNTDEFNSGLVEALKIGITNEKTLVTMLENDSSIDDIISLAVRTKLKVVQQDELDVSYRNILNFGHSVGHAIESKFNIAHGKAVFYGMYYDHVSEDVINILDKFKVKFGYTDSYDLSDLMDYIKYDKKVSNNYINLIKVDVVGEGEVSAYEIEYLEEKIKNA